MFVGLPKVLFSIISGGKKHAVLAVFKSLAVKKFKELVSIINRFFCRMEKETSMRDKMVGRTRKSDVKSRLGNRGKVGGRAKPGKIRDARDVLRKKVPGKVTLVN